jgi:hypothetical protein
VRGGLRDIAIGCGGLLVGAAIVAAFVALAAADLFREFLNRF